jgi:hypothetical protein
MMNHWILATGTVCLLLSLTAGQAHALSYYEDFNTDASAMNEYGGTVTHVSDSGNSYAKIDLNADTRGGAYTYGPGKTILSGGFGILRQSMDIYVDPSSATVGTPITWTLEVLLRTSSGNAYGEFDFFGRWLQDSEDLDGDGETTDWIYKLGRNNDWRSAPTVVDQAGWFTFTSEWIDDGSTLTNHNYISQGGNILFTGDAVQSPWGANSGGAETGYMWLYGRNDSTATLSVDNIRYEVTQQAPIPEPVTLLAFGSAVVGLGGYIRKRRGA